MTEEHPVTQERRHCGRCEQDVLLWYQHDPADHPVIIQGPLSIERVAVDHLDNTMTYRAEEPFIVVACSERETTLRALDVRRDPNTVDRCVSCGATDCAHLVRVLADRDLDVT